MGIKLNIKAIHLARSAPITISTYNAETKEAEVLLTGPVSQSFEVTEGDEAEIHSVLGKPLLLEASGEVKEDPGTSNKGNVSSATSGCANHKAIAGVCNKACFS